MNFVQLRELVSYWVDDLHLTYFTAPQVNQFLNNALRETQKILLGAGQDFYYSCKQTTLVVNQADYVLPADFYKVNRLEVVISGTPPNESKQQLITITPNQQNLVPDNTGLPNFYYLKKSRLTVLPAPSQALTLRMFYSYKIADMVDDTDTPDIPEPYHEFIAVLAAIDCFLKDGRDPSTLFNKRDYYLDMFKKDAAQRELDASRSVIYTGDFDTNDVGYW